MWKAPSVDELLNMAEVAEATLTETNDVIEIDADTRTMIIPDTERIFGVMSDEKGCSVRSNTAFTIDGILQLRLDIKMELY